MNVEQLAGSPTSFSFKFWDLLHVIVPAVLVVGSGVNINHMALVPGQLSDCTFCGPFPCTVNPLVRSSL